jgi:hypothetical protein
MKRPDEDEDKFDHDPLRTGWQGAITGPDELRKYVNALLRDGIIGVMQQAVELAAADAWEADIKRAYDYGELILEHQAVMAEKQARIEVLMGLLRECRDYAQWDIEHQSEQRLEAVGLVNAIDAALAGKE